MEWLKYTLLVGTYTPLFAEDFIFLKWFEVIFIGIYFAFFTDLLI